MATNLYTAVNGACPNGSWRLQAFSLTQSAGIPTPPYSSTTFTYTGGTATYTGTPLSLSGGYNITVGTLPNGFYHFVYTTTGCCTPTELNLYIAAKKNSPIVLLSSYTNNNKRLFSAWGNPAVFPTGNSAPYDNAFDVGILELTGSNVAIKYKWFLQDVTLPFGGGFTVNYTQLGTSVSSNYLENIKIGGQTANGTFQVGDIIDEILYESGGPSYTDKFNTASVNVTIGSNNSTNSTNLTNAFRAAQSPSIQSNINVVYNNGYINLYSTPYPGSASNSSLSTGEVWRINYIRGGNPMTVTFNISATGQVYVNYTNTSQTYANSGCQSTITRTYPSFVNIFGIISNPAPFWLTTRGLATTSGEIYKFYSPSENPIVAPGQWLKLNPNGQATNPYTSCYSGTSLVTSIDCPTEITGITVTPPATVSGNTINWNGSTVTSYTANYTPTSLCCL